MSMINADTLKSIKAITLSHNHVMMFVRIATEEHWLTFQGPYNKADYHELEDPSNNKTIFEMEFTEMKLTGYGRLNGKADIKAVGEGK